MAQIHQIKSKIKKKKKKTVGRGGKRGTYSGKGLKGQKSRAGRKMRPEMRDIIKKIPKKRGYSSPNLKEKIAVVNFGIIEKKFKDGEKITPQVLLAKEIIKKINGKMPKVKLLAGGEISKKIIVEGCMISDQAKSKLEKAGGQYVEQN